MALYQDLKVYKDTYRLIELLFHYTRDFGREYKYTLGQDIRQDGMHLVRNIYRANRAVDKREHLDAFLDDFELLKLEIRLAVDMRLISIKRQAELSVLMSSISRQITGWRRSNIQKISAGIAEATVSASEQVFEKKG